jgi:glycosyltransferase involved in cell wall biosynthesis
MKITYAITKGTWGGAQKYVLDLAIASKKEGFDVNIISGEEGRLVTLSKEAEIPVITLPNLKRDINLKNEVQSFVSLYEILKKEKPDVLHLNSPKMGGIGALIGNILGVKRIIYTAHGWTFNESRPLWQKMIIKFISWVIIVLCDYVIVLSDEERTQVATWPFVRPDQLKVVPIGVSPIKFKTKEEARTHLLSASNQTMPFEETLWLGTIAELHKNKGLSYALQAVANIRVPFIYFIIGEGEKRKELENEIRHLHIESKVFLIGFQEDANSLLSAFDIFLFPSIKEGLPFALLEAGLASLPVISTNVGGIPSVITGPELGILVSPMRPNEISNSIERVNNMPDKGKNIGLALTEKIETAFAFTGMVKKVFLIYN